MITNIIKEILKIYLFIITGQALVVRLWCLLQPLVFCRLPHGGAPAPDRDLPGATCPQSPQKAAPASEKTQSVSPLWDLHYHQEDRYSILHVTALVQRAEHVISDEARCRLQYSHHNGLPHLGKVSFPWKWDNEFLMFTVITGLCSLTDWSVKTQK